MRLDEEGRIAVRPLLFRRGDPVFAAFDVLWLNGEDLRSFPLMQRKLRLGDAVPESGERLVRVDAINGHGEEFFTLACKLDLEGVVGKWAAGLYSGDGRTTSWVKVKNPNYSQAEGRGELFEGRRQRAATRAPQLVLLSGP